MNRPTITISYAQTLDGKIATINGDSHWISGPESLTFAHELRNTHKCILVGIGTVLKDNPQLTCRIPGGKNPIRIILDPQLKIPLDSKVLLTDQAPTWIFHGKDTNFVNQNKLLEKGVKLFEVCTDQLGHLKLTEILTLIYQEGQDSLFVEGGGQIITAFIKEKLFDRLSVVVAPMILGTGISAVGDLGIQKLSEALSPLDCKILNLGKDVLFDLYFTTQV